MSNRILFGLCICFAIPISVFAGNVESFNSRLFDLQYFTRPYERAAIAGGTWAGSSGSAAATLQNPAGLGAVAQPDLLTYWTFNFFKGETYGLQGIIPPSPTHPDVERVCEKPLARLSDIGAFQAFRLGRVPGTFGAGVDYLWNDITGDTVSRIEQSGLRPGISYGIPLGQTMRIGYGLTYLQDTFHWTVSWPHFTPGVTLPRNVDYLMKSEGKSWRHRLGLQGIIGSNFRYGLEGEVGLGHTDNTWNEVDTGGDNDMQHQGVRLGCAYDLTPHFTVSADGDWHKTLVEFGNHDPAIGGNGHAAKWDATVYRPMLGLLYSVTDNWKLLGGYRYSIFRVDDLCHKTADNEYSTVSLGTEYTIKAIHLLWNIEYSDVDPNGEWMNVLAIRNGF